MMTCGRELRYLKCTSEYAEGIRHGLRRDSSTCSTSS